MKPRRNLSPLAPLTPEPCDPRGQITTSPKDWLEQRLASQDSRLNGQQKLITDMKRNVRALRKAYQQLVLAVQTMGAPLLPVEESKGVAHRLKVGQR